MKYLLALLTLCFSHSVFSYASELYSSVFAGSSPIAKGAVFTLKGLDNVDDISGNFLDRNNDGIIDAAQLETLGGGSILGNAIIEYQPVVSNGIQMIRLPIVESNNFTPTIADLLPGLPDEAILMAPVTDDDRIDLRLGSGAPLVDFATPVAGDIEPDDGGGEPQSIDINLGLLGPWFDSDIPGQGFLIDVIESIQFIFITWYTYAPDGSLQWYTAGGNYQGSSAELELLETSNGVFNQPTDVIRTNAGTLNISFTDCTSGIVEFDIPELGLQDTINISRVTPDQICQALIDGTVVLP